MAGEAVLRCLLIVFAMALNAPAHLEFLGRQTVLPPLGVWNQAQLVDLLNRAVALLALDSSCGMSVVAKLHVLRQAVNLYPLDRRLLFPVLLQDLNPFELVVFFGELAVAAHAEFD